MKTTTKMGSVREYAEGLGVDLERDDKPNDKYWQGSGRWVVTATNEGGYNCTQVDLGDLVTWLKANRPDLLA